MCGLVTLAVLGAPLLADGNSFQLSDRLLESVQTIGCGTGTIHVSVQYVVLVRIAMAGSESLGIGYGIFVTVSGAVVYYDSRYLHWTSVFLCYWRYHLLSANHLFAAEASLV
jgi:hypothetical protein